MERGVRKILKEGKGALILVVAPIPEALLGPESVPHLTQAGLAGHSLSSIALHPRRASCCFSTCTHPDLGSGDVSAHLARRSRHFYCRLRTLCAAKHTRSFQVFIRGDLSQDRGSALPSPVGVGDRGVCLPALWGHYGSVEALSPLVERPGLLENSTFWPQRP